MERWWDPRWDGNHPPQNNRPMQPFSGYPYPYYSAVDPLYGLYQAYGVPYGPPRAHAPTYGVPYNQPPQPQPWPWPWPPNALHEQWLPSQMNSFAISPARQSDTPPEREPQSPLIDYTAEDVSAVISLDSQNKSIIGSPYLTEQFKFRSEIPNTGGDDVDKIEPTVREFVRPDTTGKRVDPFDVFEYLKSRSYPPHLGKNQKSNFRRQVRPYFISEGKLLYKRKTGQSLEVVMERKQQFRLIQLAHEGGSSSFEASALSGHRGRDGVINILSKKYFWVGMNADIREFVRTCEKCQLARKDTLKVIPELRPVPVPKEVMKQVGIDICQLPPSGNLKYIVLAIDYVSKWSEAEALPDKSAASVAKFMYSCICKHSCHRVQINDQGREFVNAVSDELFRLTGTEQRITSAYHPQANGLVERQNRTVKSFLLKVLQDRVEHWPACLEGVLFAHRTMVHASTGYTPFYLLYGREAVLPLDVERGALDDGQDVDDELGSANFEDKGMDDEEETAPFSVHIFKERLESILRLKRVLQNEVQTNIKKAQAKQKLHYDKRHNTGQNLWKVGDVVLLTNPRNLSRKGGKMEIATRGPYKITAVTENFMCCLKNIKTGNVLKAKHSMKNLSAYAERKSELDLNDTHKDVKPKKEEEQILEFKEDESILVVSGRPN